MFSISYPKYNIFFLLFQLLRILEKLSTKCDQLKDIDITQTNIEDTNTPLYDSDSLHSNNSSNKQLKTIENRTVTKDFLSEDSNSPPMNLIQAPFASFAPSNS